MATGGVACCGSSPKGVVLDSDIELEIGPGSGPGNYAVRVIRAAAAGEPVGTLQLDVEELLSRRHVLEAAVLASAVQRRSVLDNERPVREVGQQLFQALFTGLIYTVYRASLGVAQQRGGQLRVVLRLTVPELAALPWEMLFDPETGTYLCRREPLVRLVPAPYTAAPLEVRPPLRILGLIASPRGLSPLDVDAEKALLAEALAGPVAEGLIEVVWVPEATWPGVHARLLAGDWHVLHFVGHGDYHAGTDEGVVALVGTGGRADLVEASRLADLLGEAQPTPRLVVLNSCSSGQMGTNDLFSGTAAALVRGGISAVAAMQFAISDAAAIAFARGFYTAIAHGRNVDEAARSGRISILGTPRTLEWVTPVLYVRGQTTQLFTLTAPPASSREDQPARGLHAEQEARPIQETGEQIKREAVAAAASTAEAQAERRTQGQAPQPDRPKIFLCYRREDTQGFARGIYQSLASKYGHEQVFRDIDSTPAGVRFSTWIESRVGQCNVMLVLIGEAWSSAKDHAGQRRLDLPKDWVRQEIVAALKRDIPIIPVRVQGAPMPSEDELPPSIADLTGFQSAEVTDSRWDFDVGLLIQAIDNLIASD